MTVQSHSGVEFPEVPPFRTFSGRLLLTVRRHKVNTDSHQVTLRTSPSYSFSWQASFKGLRYGHHAFPAMRTRLLDPVRRNRTALSTRRTFLTLFERTFLSPLPSERGTKTFYNLRHENGKCRAEFCFWLRDFVPHRSAAASNNLTFISIGGKRL